MKDEIKEILGKLKSNNYPFGITTIDINKLEDYITNLQEEIERQSKAQVILDNQITEMYDYKLRNEKAIDLLKEAGCYDEETKTFCDDVWEELPELLSILQGDDKDVKD